LDINLFRSGWDLESEKVYVITGATGGMGMSITEKFKEKGRLLLTDVSLDRLREVSRGLQANSMDVEVMECDLTNKIHIQRLIERTKEMGNFAGLIHTAGISPQMGTPEQIMKVNLMGTEMMLNAFIEIAEKGTVVVCIASMSGHMAPIDKDIDKLLDHATAGHFLEKIVKVTKEDCKLAYRLSKRGVMRLVERSVKEWGQKGARILSISPGLINTPQGRKALDEDPNVEASMIGINPLGRIGEASEIAYLVEFLFSSHAAYITGTDIRIDGGVTPVLQGK
jgi:NAD(P)-dependent dehydrogenase (short-subunit alcohol dehydrogenase family)